MAASEGFARLRVAALVIAELFIFFWFLAFLIKISFSGAWLVEAKILMLVLPTIGAVLLAVGLTGVRPAWSRFCFVTTAISPFLFAPIAGLKMSGQVGDPQATQNILMAFGTLSIATALVIFIIWLFVWVAGGFVEKQKPG